MYVSIYLSICLSIYLIDIYPLYISFLSYLLTSQGFDGNSLGDTFSFATFGNGLCAVIAGLVANTAAHNSGYVAPFVVAIFPLVLVALIGTHSQIIHVFFIHCSPHTNVYFKVSMTWTENYGSQAANTSAISSLYKGFELIKNDSKIAALGLGQSCFEGNNRIHVYSYVHQI